jgi:hypothetical protein
MKAFWPLPGIWTLPIFDFSTDSYFDRRPLEEKMEFIDEPGFNYDSDVGTGMYVFISLSRAWEGHLLIQHLGCVTVPVSRIRVGKAAGIITRWILGVRPPKGAGGTAYVFWVVRQVEGGGVEMLCEFRPLFDV